MFGYIRPPLGELAQEETERFRAAYCGLCHTLGQRYGFGARFILNYDFTFLAILLGAEQKPCFACRRCAVKPFEKREVLCGSDAMALAADESVILAYWQMKDGVADHGFFGGLKYRGGQMFLRHAYEKARKYRPAFDETVRRELGRLREMEEENCPSIDRPADAFANILAAAAEEVAEEKRRRILREMLYHLGRWVYLVDAADDFEEDARSGCYNPLMARYGLGDGKFTEDTKKEFITTLDHSARLADAAVSLADFGVWQVLVESTVRRGLFYVAASVLSGKYRKYTKMRNNEDPK